MKILAGFAPKNLLYLLPLIFPLYLVKFDLRGVPFNVLEAVILLLFGGQILIWLWNLALGLRSDAGFYMKHLWLRNRGFLGWSLVFLVISLIAVIIVPESQLQIDGVTVFESKKIALGILKGWIILPYLYFTMLWFNTREKKDLFTSLYAYIFSALPLVIWAYYQYITGDFITMDARASGPFVNANYLAMYLAPAVCALWVLIVRGIVLGFKLPKFLIGVFLAAVYSVALLMTQSYGAMLAVMFSLFLFFISALNLHKRFQKLEELDLLKKIAYFLGAFALIAGLSAVVLFAPTQKWKLFTEFQQRSSNSVRLQVYRISSQFLEESPWLGIGFGQFQPLYNLKAPEILSHAPYEWVMLHPHNTFLAVWLNLGVIGLTMFLGLLFYCFRKVLLNHSYEDKFFRLLGISMLLVMLFHGVFDTYLFKNDLAMLFWLVVALCVLPRNYVIKGKVVQGARMGQKLGFPTANLQLEQSNLPMEKLAFGVYAVIVEYKGKKYLGGLSYGLRPTVDNKSEVTFEVHLLDFTGNLYDENLKVIVLDHIRDIFKFKNLLELIANIENDLKEVRQKVII
jgi:O-antigen ligase